MNVKIMSGRKIIRITLFALWMAAAIAPSIYADNIGLIGRGVMKTVSSAFSLPVIILQDSMRGYFPLGVVSGAFRGTYQTVTGTLSGAVDIARGAAPYAKYMVFFI